ncbi:MAG: hypothetical protein OEW42_21120, partial [Acidimicrobiia bacterium]|nr:hypothetical protein [Acidimicrobiia bacterium]
MRIFEHQKEWCVADQAGEEQSEDPPGRLDPIARRHAGWSAPTGGNTRNHLREQAHGIALVRLEDLMEQRLHVGASDQRREDRTPRVVRVGLVKWRTANHQPPHRVRLAGPKQVANQGGLPDPRLAFDDDDPAGSLEELLEHAAELRLLVVSTHHRRGVSTNELDGLDGSKGAGGLRDPFEVDRGVLLEGDAPAGCGHGGAIAPDQRARTGGCEPGGEVHRAAEDGEAAEPTGSHVTEVDVPGGDAHPHLHSTDCRSECHRCSEGANRIIL